MDKVILQREDYLNIGNFTKLRIIAKLHSINNETPYFSLTGDIREYIDNRWQHTSGGCIHDEILKAAPQYKTIADMHLADEDGVPMYSVENGYFYMTDESFKDKAIKTLAEHLRITEVHAAHIIKHCVDKEQFAKIVETMKPRWKLEAEAAKQFLREVA